MGCTQSQEEPKRANSHSKRKSSPHSNSKCNLQLKAVFYDEPDYYSLSLPTDYRQSDTCLHTESSDCFLDGPPIFDNDLCEGHNTLKHRMLPSIPIHKYVIDSKAYDSVEAMAISESITDADLLDRYTKSRFHGPQKKHRPQDSSDEVDSRRNEALPEKVEEEDPSQEIGPLHSHGTDPGQAIEALKIEDNSAEASISQKYRQITDHPFSAIESKEATYMELDGPDSDHSVDPDHYNVMDCAPSESNEAPEAPVYDRPNESEDSSVHQVPTLSPRNDYQFSRADFNVNTTVLAGAKAQTTEKHLPGQSPSYAIPRSKPQTIVSPTLESRVHAGVVLYPVQAGTERTLSGATVEVPISLGQGLQLGRVEVGWSNNVGVLGPGQHPITRVLHCLPHGSAFTVPVIVSISLPAIEGQVEILYSPTDVDQIPVWTKLRAVDAPESTRFTDNRNFVTLTRNRSIALFELRHFCAFLVVENGRLIEAKKAKASILLKNEFGSNCCDITIRVVLGCLEEVSQQKMMEKLRVHRLDGFRVLDDVEFNLFAGDSKSTVKVKISKLQWIPEGDVTDEDIEPDEFELQNLWYDGIVGAMFWQSSKVTNGMKPKAFAATIHIQQDERHDMKTKFRCSLENHAVGRENFQVAPQLDNGHLPQNAVSASNYMVIRRCDQLERDFPSIGCLDVTVPNPDPTGNSCGLSEIKVEYDLHSSSSEPENKGAVPLEKFIRQQKETDTEQMVKL